MIDLRGQHIFIAGGSRGIGAAAARYAAQAGASVSVNYHSNKAAAERVVAEIHALGTGAKAIAQQGDISEDGVAKRLIAEATDALGPLTGCVVSAGIFEGAAVEDMTLAFWERTMRVNLTSTFLTVQACVPHLKANRGGGIVIYTSTAGQRGSDIYSAYATSKGGQILFMRSMARELGKDRIRVNCIAPAWTETDMAAPSLDALGREEVAKNFILGRIGLPEDVAGATVFLLSDLAQFITGVTLTVDGGMDMRG
jgi:NAD(P)-dependent dehydrogenase (short-subunit alcohol dehydrogenase family)